MSVSVCFPYYVTVSAFLIVETCVRVLRCVAVCIAVLFIIRSRLLIYSAGSGVNRVQVVLSEFSVRFLCFVQARTLCRYGCMY